MLLVCYYSYFLVKSSADLRKFLINNNSLNDLKSLLWFENLSSKLILAFLVLEERVNYECNDAKLEAPD